MKVQSSLSIMLVLALSSVSFAQTGPPPKDDGPRSGAQYDRTGRKTLINKPLASEQWVITYDIETGGVTGNVLADDGTVTFLDCDRSDLVDGEGVFLCFASGGCDTGNESGFAECRAEHRYGFVAEAKLPITFFFPGNAPGRGRAPNGDLCLGVADICDLEDRGCCPGLECVTDEFSQPLCLPADRNPTASCSLAGTTWRGELEAGEDTFPLRLRFNANCGDVLSPIAIADSGDRDFSHPEPQFCGGTFENFSWEQRIYGSLVLSLSSSADFIIVTQEGGCWPGQIGSGCAFQLLNDRQAGELTLRGLGLPFQGDFAETCDVVDGWEAKLTQSQE